MYSILKNASRATLIVAMSVGLWSCGEDDIISNPSDIVGGVIEKVEIPISFDGEIETHMVPLTRAEDDNSDLFSILVTSASGGVYAYGVFDNSAVDKGLTITLDKNATYNVSATMIVDAKDVVLKEEVEGNDGKADYRYLNPFMVMEENINQFQYYPESYDTPNNYCVAMKERRWGFEAPPVDRYYGETTFDPNSGEALNIDMTRIVFELEFNVKGMEEGDTLTISPIVVTYFCPHIVLTSSDSSYDKIHSMTRLIGEKTEWYTPSYDCWGFSLKWTDKDGKEKYLDSGMKELNWFSGGNALRLERGKKYTFNIRLVTDPVDKSVSGITYEETEFTTGGSTTWSL